MNQAKPGSVKSLSLHSSPTEHQFSFEHIFDTLATQASIFLELSQLILSAVDGKNVCVFAYGQTGSGKTFTMEGHHTADGCQLGIIPRSI